MTTITKTLYCRRCNGLPERVVEEGRRDVIRCPRCGVFGDFEKARKLAVIYAGRSLTHDAIRNHQRRTAAGLKGVKHVSYRPGKIPNLSLRDFIYR